MIFLRTLKRQYCRIFVNTDARYREIRLYSSDICASAACSCCRSRSCFPPLQESQLVQCIRFVLSIPGLYITDPSTHNILSARENISRSSHIERDYEYGFHLVRILAQTKGPKVSKFRLTGSVYCCCPFTCALYILRIIELLKARNYFRCN